METGLLLSDMTHVVEFQEAVEDFLLRRGSDGVADALAGVVEVVYPDRAVQEVGPAVGSDDRLVDGAVDAAEFGDVGVGALRVVDKVVRRGQPACLASMRSRLNVSSQSPSPRISAVNSGRARVSKTSEGA